MELRFTFSVCGGSGPYEIGLPSALELEELYCRSSACGGLRPTDIASLPVFESQGMTPLSSACGRPRHREKVCLLPWNLRSLVIASLLVDQGLMK